MSTFLAKTGHVNGYETPRQCLGERRHRLEALEGLVPFPTPERLSQLRGSCWDFWPGRILIVILCFFKSGSLTRALKPGAGSVRIMEGEYSFQMASCSVW